MKEEIFGPVMTVYLYDDANYEQTLELIDNTSPYALTGSIFAADGKALLTATNKLRNAAGNVYYNKKCTGQSWVRNPLEWDQRQSWEYQHLLPVRFGKKHQEELRGPGRLPIPVELDLR
ncbi:hypothetical protein BDR06DRAFT_948541 [Suillus hirtellus]|nr:hypothetical protein BDR06DRAFT_948541 [Suillus hirtellus]